MHSLRKVVSISKTWEPFHQPVDEVDLRFAASRLTSIWANGSLINAKGTDFETSLPAKDRRVDLDGKRLSYAPLVVSGGLTQSSLDGKISISPAVRMIGEIKYRVDNPVEPVIDLVNPALNQPAKDFEKFRTLCLKIDRA